MSLRPRGRRPPRTARRALGAALCAVLFLATEAPAAGGMGSADCPAGFTRFQSAWSRRSTPAVIGCMASRGKVRFTLLAYPLSGRSRTMGPEQAKESLRAYFKKIGSVKLEDVTPKKSPENVRLYAYSYKATGENACTTHMQVKLKQDPKRLWVLASVTESARPRK